MEQTRSANPAARNIEAIDVTLAIENVQRGADHHVAPFVTQPQRHFLDRYLQLVLLVRFAPQHFVSLRDELQRRVAPFDEKLLHARVGMIEKEVASRRLPIAAGAAGLLVVGLHASRHIEVDDEPDVRPIDPHPEGVRRHHDVAPALHELVLRLLALFVVHATVVKNARYLRQLQRFRDRFDPLARRAINDAGLVLADERVQTLIFLRLVRDLRDQQFQVRPGEPRHELPRLAQSQMSENIAANFRRGRGRERRHLRAAQRFEDLIRAGNNRAGNRGPTSRGNAPRRPRKARSCFARALRGNERLRKRSGAM